MPDVDDAIQLLTDPGNVTEAEVTRPRPLRTVKHDRVIAKLRKAGAGKAEARTLALQGLEKIDGEVVAHPRRGGNQRGVPGGSEVEDWMIPADAVRW